MFVVIVGGGRVGQSIAGFFSRRGDKVVIIERKHETCESIAKSVDAVVYCGDARSKRLLQDAEVDKADVLFAVTDNDNVNLRVAATAKELGVPKVVARINHGENCDTKVLQDVDVPVCIDEITPDLFISAVVNPEYRYLLRGGGNAVALIRVQPESRLVGARVGGLEDDALIVALVARKGVYMRAEKDLVLAGDDEIIVAGSEEKIASLIERLYE